LLANYSGSDHSRPDLIVNQVTSLYSEIFWCVLTDGMDQEAQLESRETKQISNSGTRKYGNVSAKLTRQPRSNKYQVPPEVEEKNIRRPQ